MLAISLGKSPGLSIKARTEPNQTEPAEITEPAQPNLRKLIDNYAYRYRVLAPLPIRTLVLLTSLSLIIIQEERREGKSGNCIFILKPSSVTNSP